MGLKSIGAALSIGLALGWTANGWRLGEQIAEIRADHADAIADEQERARKIESGWHAGMLEIQRNAQQKLDAVAADVAVAHSAAERLRERVAELSRRPAACPKPADGGPSAETVARVYADLLVELAELARAYSEEAGRTRIAGDACVAAYDAVAQK